MTSAIASCCQARACLVELHQRHAGRTVGEAGVNAEDQHRLIDAIIARASSHGTPLPLISATASLNPPMSLALALTISNRQP